MASIGLVGNKLFASEVASKQIAYRLASIGLVGNTSAIRTVTSSTATLAYRLASIGLVGNLQLLSPYQLLFRRAYRLASIGLVGKENDTSNVADAAPAYRLASIGLVGNKKYLGFA